MISLNTNIVQYSILFIFLKNGNRTLCQYYSGKCLILFLLAFWPPLPCVVVRPGRLLVQTLPVLRQLEQVQVEGRGRRGAGLEGGAGKQQYIIIIYYNIFLISQVSKGHRYLKRNIPGGLESLRRSAMDPHQTRKRALVVVDRLTHFFTF